MDAKYANALKAFISGRPNEAPIDPGAPDPLRERGGPALEKIKPRVQGAPVTGRELLPLILAQLPLEPSYRIRPRPRPR